MTSVNIHFRALINNYTQLHGYVEYIEFVYISMATINGYIYGSGVDVHNRWAVKYNDYMRCVEYMYIHVHVRA